jgi:hypothetical protein
MNNYGFGNYHVNLTNLEVTNCTNTGHRGFGLFDNSLLINQDFVANGDFAFPVYIGTCENVLVENCIVSNVRSLASAYGIGVIEQSSGGVIRNCTVTDVSTAVSDLTTLGLSYAAEYVGFEVRAFMVETGTVGALVEGCTAQNIGNVVQTVYSIGNTYPVGNSVAGYNSHTAIGSVFRNCQASDIWSYGKITSLQPSIGLNQLVSDMRAVGFFKEIDPSYPQGQGHNAVFENCVATNINGGLNVSTAMASPAYGFMVSNVNFIVPPDFMPVTMVQLFENCAAQDVFGASDSAGFGIRYRPPFAANGHSPFPVIFENCTAQFDRINNPTGLSNGFITDARGNNTVFKNCIAQGHTLNGFDLAGDTVDNSTGNAKMILDDCIANGNSGYGFRLDYTLKQVEINNCKSTNNGLDGFNAGGRDLIFRSCISDLNLGKGYDFEAYFPFFAKVATDTDLLNLNIYGGPGTYTVQYYAAPAGAPGYYQYIQIIPNDPTQPLPASLPINGVSVQPGDIILVKDETGANAVLDGVYQANNIGGVPFGDTATPVWQLVREDPWRYNNTEPEGTKVLVAESNSPNLTHGPVMYTLLNNTAVDVNVPRFKASNCIKPDRSRIVVDSCKAAANDGDGLHNQALDVIVSGTDCSRNKGHGFVDDSIKGAEHNGNLYTLNTAYINDKSNYKIDYVVPSNPTILQVGSISPPEYPSKVAPEANISMVKKKESCKKKSHKQ